MDNKINKDKDMMNMMDDVKKKGFLKTFFIKNINILLTVMTIVLIILISCIVWERDFWAILLLDCDLSIWSSIIATNIALISYYSIGVILKLQLFLFLKSEPIKEYGIWLDNLVLNNWDEIISTEMDLRSLYVKLAFLVICTLLCFLFLGWLILMFICEWVFMLALITISLLIPIYIFLWESVDIDSTILFEWFDWDYAGYEQLKSFSFVKMLDWRSEIEILYKRRDIETHSSLADSIINYFIHKGLISKDDTIIITWLKIYLYVIMVFVLFFLCIPIWFLIVESVKIVFYILKKIYYFIK